MKKDYMDACTNPIRQRIIQVLVSKGEANTTQIREIISDVPRASLYRHIKVLLDAGVIKVIKEEQNRGSLEKTYGLISPSYEENNSQDMCALMQSAMFSLISDFNKYFEKPDNDCMKDMLAISMGTFLMTDEEMVEFLQGYSQLVQKVMNNQPSEGRKPRKLAIISAPVDEE